MATHECEAWITSTTKRKLRKIKNRICGSIYNNIKGEYLTNSHRKS